MYTVLALGCAQTAIRLGLSSLTLAALLALALPVWLLYICCSRSLQTPHKQANRQIFLGQPRLLPAQVSHTRLGTGRYNYTVPHFLVGTPVGLQGHVGRVLSVDEPETRTQTSGLLQYLSPSLASWFTVHAHHHLDKGNDARGLRGKLHDFLVSQGLSPSEWPYAYLITMPQFLGYQRNLVCIWYLYSASRELTAMIMEVNNYWGQRKIAFSRLTGETPLPAPPFATSSAETQSQSQAQSPCFYHSNPRHASYRGTWDKDMFISPFEKVEGSIALRFSDPLAPNTPLHITITLLSPSGKPRLIGRVFCPEDGDHDPLDPLAASYWRILRFLPYWTGVLVVTELLIIAAALRIRSKGAPMFSMPEVRPNNHPRDETDIERNLEPAFRAYLKHLVESSQPPLTLHYIPSKSHVLEPETFTSSPTKDANHTALTIQVLTPSFYTSFPLYTNPLTAFTTESRLSPLPSDPSSRRLYISDPELFSNLLSSLSIHQPHENPVKQTCTQPFNLKTTLCRSLIPRLRENLNLNLNLNPHPQDPQDSNEEEGKEYFLDTFILTQPQPQPNTDTNTKLQPSPSLQESYIISLCAHLLSTKFALGLHHLWSFYGAVGWFFVFQLGLSIFFFQALQGSSEVGVVGDAVLAMGCHWVVLGVWRGVWS